MVVEIWPASWICSGEQVRCTIQPGKRVPCRAGDAVAGDSAKASRSLRRADDCLRAELKREF
jgi:hypothetical protein